MIRVIHNVETGEITEVEMTLEEIAQLEADRQKAENKAIAEAKATAARQALLDKLGITEDEAKLLLS